MSKKFFGTASPQKLETPVRNERLRRFARKPDGRSERSFSRKSQDNQNLADMYIKCPASATKRPRTHNDNFFATLAASILKAPQQDEKKGEPTDQYQSEKTERTALTEWEDHRDGRFKPMEHNESVVQRLSSRVRALETSLDLKTHESSVLANECERLTHMVAEERDKQRKSESERKDAVRELKKQSKEKERVCKQIEFLERINYDEKTRTLQSYRESYLEGEMKKMREAFNRTREERERELENQVKTLQEEKFTVESHLRATKIANECLVKQINSFQDGLQDIVINSEEYRKLRDKYVRFLEEYKLLRNQFWALKAELNQKKGVGSSEESEILSITASEVDNDLSEFKSENSNPTSLHQLHTSHLAPGPGGTTPHSTRLI